MGRVSVGTFVVCIRQVWSLGLPGRSEEGSGKAGGRRGGGVGVEDHLRDSCAIVPAAPRPVLGDDSISNDVFCRMITGRHGVDIAPSITS